MKSIIICVCLFWVTFGRPDKQFPPLPSDGSCEMGRTYQDGCNICSCFAHKALLCEKRDGCTDTDKNDEPVVEEMNDEPQQRCREGEKKDGPWGGCSFCICRKEQNGKNEWHCSSDKDCHIDRRKRGTISDLKSTPCAPNDSFRLDCNTCYCNGAKSGYRCSENNCEPDNTTEILVPQNVTELVFLNITSKLSESTTTSSNISSIGSSETTFSTTPLPIERSSYLADVNVTTYSESTLSLGSSTTPTSVGNSTAEDVLSLG